MYMERPPYPGTRLDVQRHHLEDKRAGFTFMESNLRVDRVSSLTVAFQAIRKFVARAIDGDGQRAREVGTASHAPAAGTVETAETV